MRYSARVVQASGNLVSTREVEAQSRDAAVRDLEGQALVVLDLREARRAIAVRASKLDAAAWTREVRLLLNAGMTVVEALETLGSKQGDAATLGVLDGLRRGQALSTAMASAAAFPGMLVASVRAGERTGSLAQTLSEYLAYDDQMRHLRSRFVNAMVYPAVVVSIGAAVCLFLLVFVLPRFADFYAGLSTSGGVVTKVVMDASAFVARHRTAMPLGLLVALLVLVGAWRAGFVRAGASWAALRLPAVARVVEQLQMARLYQALTVMVQGGYALGEAMEHARTLHLGIPEGSLALATRSLEQGKAVSVAMQDAGLSDAVTTRLLATGERTGNFERVLGAIAQRHARTFELALERVSRLVEPVLLVLVALAVGSVVIAMYMPLFDMAASVR